MKKRLLLLLLCLTLLLTGCAAGKEQMPVFRIYACIRIDARKNADHTGTDFNGSSYPVGHHETVRIKR